MKRDSTWPARRFDKCAGGVSSYRRRAAGPPGRRGSGQIGRFI
jgi:hypothetical protein